MALPDTIQLTAGTSRTSGIAAATVNDGKNFLGAEIDNSTNLDCVADIELTWAHGSGPNGTTPHKVSLLYALDGTNYEKGAGDGTDVGSVNPLAHTLVGAATAPADTATHRAVFRDVPLAPYKFKVLVQNATNIDATVTVLVKTRNIKMVD